MPETLPPSPRASPTLRRPLGTLDLWALGVGTVIGGQYFGWNLGLAGNGPVALLAASLLVCLLFLAWVLCLAELSVAMPYADGPLAFGCRAVGPWLGFVMAWSMVLGCLFAGTATALACGNYVAFLANPARPDRALAVWTALATVLVLLLLHVWGVREQSRAMLLMTCAALAGLLLFWAVAASAVARGRAWPRQDLLGDKGWKGVLDALPYALWWLIVIEGVTLAAEETKQPQRSIPRGLVLATLTVSAMTGLTTVLACGAVDWRLLDEAYPLGKAIRNVLAGRAPVLMHTFGVAALIGLVASCHGLLYGASRQAFALGRAGYLPPLLGRVHSRYRTPAVALSACALLTVSFLVVSFWFQPALDVAILVAALASVVGNVLAVFCLLRLRRREGGLFRNYRAPFPRLLPLTVVLLSGVVVCAFAGLALAGLVFGLTVLLYAAGLGYYWLWARKRLCPAAPEEQTARLPRARPEDRNA